MSLAWHSRYGLAAIFLIIGSVLSPLPAEAATVPMLFPYDVAVGLTAATRVEARPSLRPKRANATDYDYEAVHVRYDRATNPPMAAVPGGICPYDRAIQLTERRELADGLICDAAETQVSALTRAAGGQFTYESSVVQLIPGGAGARGAAPSLERNLVYDYLNPRGAKPLFHGSDAASVGSLVENGLSKAAARELGGGDIFWATTDRGIATFFARANPAGGELAVAALQIPTTALQSLIKSGAVAIDRTGAYMVKNWGAFNQAVIGRAVAE
jgi:hypothetical protein